ncbi:ABC transporter permease subunit [Emergencia timonensis]|uniref:ABC transporter permease n=1 Tax=Emergencia timonensis TaxID=1776384 RepID=UPI001D065C95|nr:ABC transporter permease subunit [Emergencia timonensis]MBS6175448.1 ABC transporter permease subunit [Clostridiales bacterium]MCB6474726.1 ABC transporter permease subunit [Emergencia timonensis]
MKNWNLSVVISHVLLAALFVAVLLPGEKKTAPYSAMLCALALMEGAYLYRVRRRPGKLSSASDIMSILWALMLVWEVLVSKLDLCHPVLAPALENIFAVFSEDYLEMGRGILSSLEILLIGVVVGLALGTLLGLICGWHQRLKEVFFPIAGVLAPIPSIVFAPYVIAIMPTFRSASVVVILLGIFWPTFLKTIISVESIDKNMVDSARTLELGGFAMIFEVLLPYSMPGIVKGLKVTMTTAVMMLTFAEMMGSTVGMGYYIVNYNTYGNYTKVIAGIMVVGLVVTLLSSLVSVIQKKAIKWQNY